MNSNAFQINKPEQQKIVDRFIEIGQQHIFATWNSLLPEQQAKFLKDLETIDLDFLKKMQNLISHPLREIKSLETCKYIKKPKSRGDRAREEDARRSGEFALKEGKVAIFLAAGGQGTRLNFKGPKGKYEIGPLSHHTLFQIYAEKILALQRRYEVTFPIWIMTSKENHAETEQFFFKNNLFGLLEQNIHFVQQEMVPSLDISGKLFLADPYSVVKNPNGDGGCIELLQQQGILEELLQEGREYLFYFHVDNPLTQIADPTLIGWHIKEKAECSTKVFVYSDTKHMAEIVALVNGKASILEPEEITEEIKNTRDEEGNLKYRLGNTSTSVFSLSFLQRIDFKKWCYHKYLRKIPYMHEKMPLIFPEKENGYKFELCMSDIFGEATNITFVEVDGKEEYAPIKSATGVYTADLAQRQQTNLFASWLEQATIDVPRDDSGQVQGVIEISPLFASSAQELKQKLTEKKPFDGKLLLE